MTVFDLYSKRKRRERGDFPDVYQYTFLPDEFRVQVMHILSDLYGCDQIRLIDKRENWFKGIHDALCREYGLLELNQGRNYQERVFSHLRAVADIDHAFDIIELALVTSSGFHDSVRGISGVKPPRAKPSDAMEELNTRLKEHGIGFQFESGEIVRVDSQLLHEEAVKPALHVLRDERFVAANDEFLKAHEHYRHGNHAEAINECLKSFESTLKGICHTQGWAFDDKWAAKQLLDVVFQNDLIPKPMQSAFGGLRSILEGSVPTVRNRLAGHGAGTEKKDIPGYIASYVLHVTASSILLLTEAEKAL